MNGSTTTRRLDDLKKGRSDWTRVDALTEAETVHSIEQDPDTEVADKAWFPRATILRPSPERQQD